MKRTPRLTLGPAIGLALILALTVALAGCQNSVSAEESTPAETSSETDAQSGPMNDDDLRAALEAQYGDAPWYPKIMWIGSDQVLLANVTRVETDLGNQGTDYDTAVEISDAVWDILSDQDVINVAVIAADGMQLAASGSGSPMSEVMDLPPAPNSADELQAWIDEVYGDSGEDWYGYLTDVELSDSISGWQGTTLVVLRTDIEDRDEAGLNLASKMGGAVASSGQTMAENYVVYMKSGEHMLSGNLPSGSSYSY